MWKQLARIAPVLGWLAATAGAQLAPAPHEAKPADTCVIEGRLLNAASGEPVPKARLTLTRTVPAETGGGQSQSYYTTTTDADGRFSVTELPSGSYRLRAQRNGFVNAEYGAKRSTGTGTLLTLEKGQRLTGIEFKLTPHAVIAGHVLDESGEPVANASLRAIRYGYQYGRKQSVPVGSATTNDLGEYRLFGIPPGRYFVVARDVSTLQGGSAEDRSGNPKAAEDYVPTFYPSATVPQSAIQLDATGGVPLQGVDITLAKARMVRLRGRVINQTDASGARISVMLLPWEPMGYPNILSPSMGPQGTFEFRKLVPGGYSLAVSVGSGQVGTTTYARHMNLDIGAEDIENLVITVTSGSEISGSVRAEGTEKVDVTGLRVSVRPAERVGLTSGSMPSATVGEDGSFVLKNAGGEPQQIVLSGLPTGAYVKSIRMGDRDALENPLDLRDGAAGKLSIILGENAGEITGTVVDDNQKPVPGATVVLVPDSERRRPNQQFYRTATTNQAGQYSLTGIDPGGYRIYAWEDVESGAWMDPEFMEPLRNKGKAIRIDEGTRETLELKVIPAAG